MSQFLRDYNASWEPVVLYGVRVLWFRYAADLQGISALEAAIGYPVMHYPHVDHEHVWVPINPAKAGDLVLWPTSLAFVDTMDRWLRTDRAEAPYLYAVPTNLAALAAAWARSDERSGVVYNMEYM